MKNAESREENILFFRFEQTTEALKNVFFFAVYNSRFGGENVLQDNL